MNASATDLQAGFFGKVRTHGDFVTRRLPASFTRAWDDWLQDTMQASRKQLGTLWLNTYLNSSIWRFALAPGVCGEQAWAGVLMPSVDKVGRHFPLTIAAATAVNDAASLPLLLPEWMVATGAWYDQLETLALSALREDFSLDAFDASLRLIATPPHTTVIKSTTSSTNSTNSTSSTSSLGLHEGHSLWWTASSQQIAPHGRLHQGLPIASAWLA